MTNESSLGVPSALPDAGASQAVDSPSTQGQTGASEQTASDVITPVQGEQTQAQDDPLAGVPSADELKQLAEQNVPHAKALAQLRSAYDTLKPQFTELSEKFKPYESYLEKIQSPEDLETALGMREKLFGWERDPDTQQLIPATQSFVEDLAKQSPVTADFLAADLLNGLTQHPETGAQIPRIDLALESMAKDPERKATAARILGLVEPSSIAPTWLPSEEELARIAVDPEKPTPQDKALQDVYSKLPWDERQSLKENDDAFIRRTLQREKQLQDLERVHQQDQELKQRQGEARENYMREQAQSAGNQFVERGFKEGFTEFANSIVERSKFISPIDPNSDVARQMAPEQLSQMNQQIQQTNNGIGRMIATVTAALSHPDTAWVAADFLKAIGVDEKSLQAYDAARQEYANNARSFGELNYRRNLGQNGNGNNQPGQDLGPLQSNASRAMKTMKGQGNLIAGQIMGLMSKFFEMKAGSYNQTLNGAAVARPPIQGQAFDPTTAASQRPTGWMSKQEIDQFAR